MKKLLYFFLLFAFGFAGAQQYVIGKVTTENDTQVPGVIVYNVNSEQMAHTDNEGNFIIKASVNNELRFIKRNFDRVSITVRADNFSKPLNISIQLLPQTIEEVEIAFKPSGDLKKDNDWLISKKTSLLNQDVRSYIRGKSSVEIMQPKPGQFVQPKGEGFETVKYGYKWEEFDLAEFLHGTLSEENYFTSVGLSETESLTFILFVLKDFEKNNNLRFGYCSDADVVRFKMKADEKIDSYRKRTDQNKHKS